MELDLSLGDASKPLGLLSKNREASGRNAGFGFCMALGISSDGRNESNSQEIVRNCDRVSEDSSKVVSKDYVVNESAISTVSDRPVQLDLLPLVPVLRHSTSHSHGFPLSSDNGSSEGGSSGNGNVARMLDMNRLSSSSAAAAAAEEVSSPNSAASSLQMDFSLFRRGGNVCVLGNKRELECNGNDVVQAEIASFRVSDEDENSLNPRKKLRLSKEQSAFLEESFKEHHTLNPKQKIALANQLHLSPRQIEVWFQNRRARTKLKQTEVDCEYLKRYCETLKEENKRLKKELQELRALKSSNNLYMQPPATTLTMCPACERVGPTASAAVTDVTPIKAISFPISKQRLLPMSETVSNNNSQ